MGGGAGLAPAPSDGLYFMSNEVPGPTAVLTDDFRRGSWYLVDADQYDWRTTAPGWAGTIFANPITPSGAIRNLQSIGKRPLFATSDYVGTSGVIVNSARNMALHNLSGANNGGYEEVYFRCYVFFVPADYYGAGDPSSDYRWGGQKTFSVNRWDDDGGIWWAGFQYNFGAGSDSPTGTLAANNPHGTGVILAQNQGVNISMVPGKWYFIEWHIRLNDVGQTNGLFELWINDGGSNGNFSGQTPTLRAQHTDVDYGRGVPVGSGGGGDELIGNVWLENWSNEQISSTGEQFWANIYAATSGPIGFVP